jgi:hypothetical protein
LRLEAIPTGSRPTSPDGYRSLVRRVRAAVRASLPADATVLVVSRGDDELLELDGRRAWHFPRDEEGKYAGYHPADSTEAIAHLEKLRDKGAQYLLIPSTSFWWLGHYSKLASHLANGCRLVVREDETCLVFALLESPAEPVDLPSVESSDHRLAQQLREVAHNLLPQDAVVVVVSEGDDALIALDEQQGWHFPRAETGAHAGYDPLDSAAAVADLKSLEPKGAQFLLIPCTAFTWLDRYPGFAQYLRHHHRFITRQENVCEIYELCTSDTEASDSTMSGGVVLPLHRFPVGRSSLSTQESESLG